MQEVRLLNLSSETSSPKFLVIEGGDVKLTELYQGLPPKGSMFILRRAQDNTSLTLQNENGRFLSYDPNIGERVGVTEHEENATEWSISDQGFISCLPPLATLKKYLWGVGDDVYLTQDTHVRDKWRIIEEKGKDVTYHASTDKSFYIKIGIGLAILVGLFVVWKCLSKNR